MPTPQPHKIEAGRWLAHHIIYQGHDYGFAVLNVAPDGHITVEPFSGETHSTVFHSGTITVTPTRLLFS